MTVEEILKLGAMGYTKDDIEAMVKTESENKVPENKEPENKEPEKKEPEKAEPAEDPTKDLLKFMAGEFEKLQKSIQDANILGSDIEQHKEKTAEDVLAELIAPPRKKGGK